MYKIEFEGANYNRLEFICKDAVELGGLISQIYRHTTDDFLTFRGCQVVPVEDVKTEDIPGDFYPMEDDLEI